MACADERVSIYCDESCHLENDGQPVMVLGAISCPTSRVREIADGMRAIKKAHGLAPRFELKWQKVSPKKLDLYLDLVDYFFDVDDLHFRALVVPDKSVLCHEAHNQTHDVWYYKMYFELLRVLLKPTKCYSIYLDIKDTRSGDKVAKLHEVLCNNLHDFEHQIIAKVQMVRSHELEQVQLADLLIGAVNYANRSADRSFAKKALVERMRLRSSHSLTQNTALREDKCNIFVWRPADVRRGQ